MGIKKRRGPKMTIEFIAIPGLVFLAATMVAKLFELQNDVLYGPYIEGRKHSRSDLRDALAEMLLPMGLRQAAGRFALKLGTLGCFASAIIG
jgi:hypothetical protein